MNQQPDKLFHDKLYRYQKPVPPDVWKRITENRAGRTPGPAWLRAAASLLVVSAAAALIYPLMKPDRAPLAIKNSETASPGMSPTPIEPQANESQAIQNDQTAKEKTSAASSHESGVARKNRPRRLSPVQQRTATETEESIPPVVEVEEPQVSTTEHMLAEKSSEPPATAQQPQTTSQHKTVTIVFTADEVNQKYLSKKDESHATSDKQQPSTLQNLLDKARDLKHNQDPLGEIRQKKDEILAMNFRKDKQRTEKN